MSETEEKQEKPKNLTEILNRLTKDQLRFIVALQEYPSKEDAAKAIKIKPSTAYGWPDYVDEAARLMALDTVQAALELRKRNLVKAMGVKAAGLDSKDERIRQNVATEIIEWETGKAQSKTDITSGGHALTVLFREVSDADSND
jgi:hypothetical protein